MSEMSEIIRNNSFYSEDVFLFHPKANVFPLISPSELNELGASIAQAGQEEDIELFEGKILDGRNRYLACKLYNITPRFIHLPEDIDAEEHVDVKNFYRRHLTTAQRADYALKRLDKEKKKAKDRKLSQLIQNKKRSDPTSEGGTGKKGEAIEIVAKKYGISKNSVKTAKKVRDLNDIEINEKWAKARCGETTIKNVAEAIRNKFPSEIAQKSKNLNNLSYQKHPKDPKLKTTQLEKVERIINAAEKYPEIKKQWKEVKENKRSLEEVDNNIGKISQVIPSIHKGIMDNLREVEDRFLKPSKRAGNKISTKSNKKTKISSKKCYREKNNPKCEALPDVCHNPNNCPKAHLFVTICPTCNTIAKCSKCIKPVFVVNCDDDYMNGEIAYRKPIFPPSGSGI